MNDNIIQGKIIRPFSPAIGKYTLPEKIINILNSHIDDILKDEKKIEELYHGQNLAGEIKYEIELSKDFINLNLHEVLKNYVYNYRNKKGSFKGTPFNTAGWTSVEVAGKIIEKIGPILATKYMEIN